MFKTKKAKNLNQKKEEQRLYFCLDKSTHTGKDNNNKSWRMADRE